MAFGDIVNTEKVSVASGDPTITISPTATLGNLLVINEGRASQHTAGGAWGAPSGWNILHDAGIATVGANMSGAAYWKISDGTETSAVTAHTTPNGNAQAVYVEFEGPFEASPLDQQAENNDGLGSVVTSQTTGTTGTTSQADELIIALFNGDAFQNVDGGGTRNYSNSFVERVAGDISSARATAFIASKVVSAIGTQECTFSVTDIGDEMYGQIVTFKKAGGAPASVYPTGTNMQMTGVGF